MDIAIESSIVWHPIDCFLWLAKTMWSWEHCVSPKSFIYSSFWKHIYALRPQFTLFFFLIYFLLPMVLVHIYSVLFSWCRIGRPWRKLKGTWMLLMRIKRRGGERASFFIPINEWVEKRVDFKNALSKRLWIMTAIKMKEAVFEVNFCLYHLCC